MLRFSALVFAAALAGFAAHAQSSPPAGATAQCKDGTYYTGTSHSGACSRHHGVQQWLSGNSSSGAAPASTPAETAAASSPRGAPTGATALCKDGTYYTGASHSGACSRHKGVQQWLNGGGSTASAPPPSRPAATTEAPRPIVPQQTQATTPMSSGGGAEQVWVNTSTHVYHCPGDAWYGKTKHGKYMSESDAKAAGNRADHNRPCR